jgi:hypothetical protein
MLDKSILVNFGADQRLIVHDSKIKLLNCNISFIVNLKNFISFYPGVIEPRLVI